MPAARGSRHVRICIGLAVAALAFLNAYVAIQHLNQTFQHSAAAAAADDCTITIPSPDAYISSSSTTTTSRGSSNTTAAVAAAVIPTVEVQKQGPPEPKQNQHSIIFVHIGKTGGETIRNLLPVACNMRKNPGHYKSCVRRFQQNQALNSTPLSQQTTGTIHCDLTEPKNAVKIANTVLVSVRNPVERVVSWYRYIHPGNCNKQVDRDSVACNIKRIMSTPGENDSWRARFFGCFPSLEAMGESLDPLSNTNCSLLAKRTILGSANKLSGHMFFNYGYYWKKTMVKKRSLQSLVVRTESLWTDIDDIQEMLWQEEEDEDVEDKENILHNHPRLNHTHGSEGHKRADSIASGPSLQWLCCILTKEVDFYVQWIRRAINLSDKAKKQTLMDLVQRCGVQNITIFDSKTGWEDQFCDNTTFASMVKATDNSPW